MKKKPSAADMLRRQLSATPEPKTTKVEGDLEQGVARELDRLGVAKLAKPEPAWWDKATEIGQAQQDLEAEWKRRKDAEEAAKQPEPTTASILMTEVARAATGSSSAYIPLNGAAVLKRAMSAMGTGKIHGGDSE